MTVRDLARRVLARFAVYRVRLVASLLIVVASTGVGVVLPLLLRRVIDEAIPNGDRRLLTWLCLAMLLIGFAQAVLFLAQGRLANSIGLSVVHDLRADVYRRVQRMPITFHAGPSGTEVHTRLAHDIGGISDVVTFTAQHALGSVTIVATVGAAMLVLSWPIAAAAILLTTAMAVITHVYAEKQRLLAVEVQDRTSEMMRLAGEHLSLSGILLGRTLRRWDRQRAAFERSSADIARLTTRQRTVGDLASAIVGVSFAAVPPTVYWLAGGGFTSLSVGTALVLVALQMQLTGPIQDLLGVNTRLRVSLAQFERVFEYLDMGPVGDLPAPAPAVAAAPRPVAVRVRDLGYAYPGTGRTVVAGVDLDFPAGSSTTIVGATGSGKSTLAYLIAGLLRPDRGTVSVAPELVTLVPQEAGMLNATIRENLLFARPDATTEELRAVLAALALDTLVAELPDGLDTEVGERGYQLSGGERQRLALARGLLTPSPVLVLDEVTSSLDWATGRVVQEAIATSTVERTVIVVSHRLGGLADPDRVVVMRDGRVVEAGTHGSLRASDGEYARLLRARDEDLAAERA